MLDASTNYLCFKRSIRIFKHKHILHEKTFNLLFDFTKLEKQHHCHRTGLLTKKKKKKNSSEMETQLDQLQMHLSSPSINLTYIDLLIALLFLWSTLLLEHVQNNL